MAFVEWHGLELNALTGATGLPEARVVVRDARELELRTAGRGLVVPLADAFDILANKLAIRRDKDLPHIDVLRRFVEEEVVSTMRTAHSARARIAPANRLLGERLIELGDELPIRRFLVARLATKEQAERVLAAAPSGERDELAAILAHRSFSI